MTEQLKEIMNGASDVQENLQKMNGRIKDLDEDVSRNCIVISLKNF